MKGDSGWAGPKARTRAAGGRRSDLRRVPRAARSSARHTAAAPGVSCFPVFPRPRTCHTRPCHDGNSQGSSSCRDMTASRRGHPLPQRTRGAETRGESAHPHHSNIPSDADDPSCYTTGQHVLALLALTRIEATFVWWHYFERLGWEMAGGAGGVEQQQQPVPMERGGAGVGGWLPRGFLLPLGTGITFGFGCAYLLLSVLSLDPRGGAAPVAVGPLLLAALGPARRPLAGRRGGRAREVARLARARRRVPPQRGRPRGPRAAAGGARAVLGDDAAAQPRPQGAPREGHMGAPLQHAAVHELPRGTPRCPAVALNVTESRSALWAKTKAAFDYVARHHLRDHEWFLKADDDTYVVVENLRYFLRDKNASEAVYYGCRFRPYVKQGYMSGGAGYVLSREAVRRLAERGPHSGCRADGGGAEDVEMGRCLQRLGVAAGDTRDSAGRGRFFPLVPESHLIPGQMPKDFWLWSYTYYPLKEVRSFLRSVSAGLLWQVKGMGSHSRQAETCSCTLLESCACLKNAFYLPSSER
ncbi:hypothetical protein HPB48_023359 [Haemaphysalis longicornis]|uniref:N-acetylgalactosaminide beta-1,3-galactosyltransferase n=1 Tax=Haemaphysalis longicornis TaxID=44386 RepID=A0A9J6H7W9_HAELO|nr:hypothetical protein HPB48_023359 [Haemaphysalis longicornis]